MSGEEEFSIRALEEADRRLPRLRPYAEDEVLSFGHPRQIRFGSHPKISDDFETQVRYWVMRCQGESHGMAEVLATRQFPGALRTERAFMQGRQLDGAQFQGLPRPIQQDYMRQAAAAGVNTTGKYYLGTIAEYPGDPRAWVSGSDDVRRICVERGWGSEGSVKVEKPKYTDGYVSPEKYAVAPDLVAERVDDQIEAQPELAPQRAELLEKTAEKMAGQWGE